MGIVSRRSGLVALLVLSLVGCGDAYDPAADNHGYGWAYDAEGETGLRLRWEPTVPAQPGIDLAWFETRYRETATCLGIDPPPVGPFVIVIPYPTVDGHGGWYWADPPLVLVTDGGFNVGFAEAYMDNAARHEFVHYLLGRTGHDHPGFAACAPFEP